jgi:hypothetical protein
MLAEKLLEVQLKDFGEDMERKKTLEWKKFIKVGKRKGINTMKRLANKWLGREKAIPEKKLELKGKKLQKGSKSIRNQ